MNELILNEIKTIRNKLFGALEQLEESIYEAHESFKMKYGDDHFCITRLQSYYPALDKQRSYIVELDSLIATKSFDNYHLVTAICTTSEFIKEDAKSLLHLMQTGKELIPDDVIFH